MGEAVDPEAIETLDLSYSKAAGDWLAPLVGRKFEMLRVLGLGRCEGLQSLPEGVFDKAKIIKSIGEGHEDLDNLVHGVMARAGLGKALAAYGPGERLVPFL